MEEGGGRQVSRDASLRRQRTRVASQFSLSDFSSAFPAPSPLISFDGTEGGVLSWSASTGVDANRPPLRPPLLYLPA